MHKTQSLRKQHGDIAIISRRLRLSLRQGEAAVDAAQFRALLNEMAGTLAFHLGVEDGMLYPELLASVDAPIRETAKRFVKEMGGLKSAFQAYHHEWQEERIVAERERFIAETIGVLDALDQRIRRENEELYPLLER